MEPKIIKVQIKQTIDKVHEITISDGATVLELKEEIEKKTNIKLSDQKIIFRGFFPFPSKLICSKEKF